MPTLSPPAQVSVRAPVPGEGTVVAGLWRELWDTLEAFGGYRGSREPEVYAAIARLLDDDARARSGHPVRGRHVHLVSDVAGVPCGQVQGWFARHGTDPTTPYTCEVRSLIVTARARGLGAGRLLLRALTASARILSGGMPCALAAEVLEANPALAFYEHAGYVPIAYSARVDSARWALDAGGSPGHPVARVALPRDAPSLARLDRMLASRRRAAGDVRFDRPGPLDSANGDALAARLGADAGSDPSNPILLVSVDADGVVCGGAFFAVQPLEPPFVPIARALVGGFAVEPTCARAPVVTSLIGLACRLAVLRGAPQVEVADLSSPGSELHSTAIAAGAVPWSRVMLKLCRALDPMARDNEGA